MRSRIIPFGPILIVGFVVTLIAAAMATPAGRAHPDHEHNATPGPEGTAEAEAPVDVSSETDRFHEFCAGQIDIVQATRPMDDDEVVACAAAGVGYQRFLLGIDAIAVVTRPNAVADCLTIEQLRSLWAPEATATTWHDLDPAWPGQEIALYGAEPGSSTFAFYTEAIAGEAGATRPDVTATADDQALIEGLVAEEQALGYAGYAAFVSARNRLKAITVDSGHGCVAPSRATIGDGSYGPLSRPLSLYVNWASLARPEVQAFMRYSLATAKATVAAAGYALLDDGVYRANQAALETAIADQQTPTA
jgi:phosphate transport system substrate-binding protein